MFGKLKARKIVKRALADTEKIIQTANQQGICFPIGVTSDMINCLFIAFCDFYAFISKHTALGDLIVEEFLNYINDKSLVKLYKELIVESHTKYHSIVKECFQEDKSPNGLAQGYMKIGDYICDRLEIDVDNELMNTLVSECLLHRHDDVRAAF